MATGIENAPPTLKKGPHADKSKAKVICDMKRLFPGLAHRIPGQLAFRRRRNKNYTREPARISVRYRMSPIFLLTCPIWRLMCRRNAIGKCKRIIPPARLAGNLGQEISAKLWEVVSRKR